MTRPGAAWRPGCQPFPETPRSAGCVQPAAQMAAELGLTVRGVEGRLHRLRKRLKRELGGGTDA